MLERTYTNAHASPCTQAQIIRVLGSLTTEDVATMASSDSWIPDAIPPYVGKPWHSVLVGTLQSGRSVSKSYGPEFEDLLSSLLCWQPAARLSAVQAAAHAFFTS